MVDRWLSGRGFELGCPFKVGRLRVSSCPTVAAFQAQIYPPLLQQLEVLTGATGSCPRPACVRLCCCSPILELLPSAVRNAEPSCVPRGSGCSASTSHFFPFLPSRLCCGQSANKVAAQQPRAMSVEGVWTKLVSPSRWDEARDQMWRYLGSP